ncbi:MAG: NAD(P)H-binding protein [Pseudomonadota bacterium]
MKPTDNETQTGEILVIGATGKTGSRIVNNLKQRGLPVRSGSRSATPPFDWQNPSGWQACLSGVSAIFISYAPDLAVPGARDAIVELMRAARTQGVQRAVILSGRGEPEAQACEKVVMSSGLEWTVVRASWFNQNFSEGAFVEMVNAGVIQLPAGKIAEPFVDVDDIAEVATVALTEPGHNGQVYEVTGPRLLTFGDVAKELSRATGRSIAFTEIPHEAFVRGVAESGAPEVVVWMMDYLFSVVLDGRNASLTDGVERALGRQPKDFSAYARDAAASGQWGAAA